jgi:hypothetical protein
MSNPKGSTPPVNTAESNKLQGCIVPTVEIFGLEAVVRKMKKRPRNYGDMAIADEINNTILKDSEEKISHMAIWRWWKKHKDDEDPDEDIVNIYGAHLSSLKSITKQLEILEMYVDNLNSSVSNVDEVIKVSKEVSELMKTYDKLSMRKQTLLGTIGEIQEKVYDYMKANEVVTLTLQAVMDEDVAMYARIMGKLRENREYMELIKKIMPASQ